VSGPAHPEYDKGADHAAAQRDPRLVVSAAEQVS
jgi:hypothetical protein